MADLRIVDAPEIPTENITGEEKLPTGGNGNYSISLDSLADYTKTKKDLADNTSVDGKVNGVRQELNTHVADLLNPHQVTKGQIGLGNVDNTADADKPVSNSTQAAIISAVAPKADKTYVDTALSSKAEKTYVDNQLTLKANKVDVHTKLETYTKQESSDLVNNSISTALTPVNSSLDLAKRGIANRYDSSLTYNSGERVVLTNDDIVKSTIDGNINDPNVDMTGWVKTNSASQIFDENGLSQQQLNDGVESIADLLTIPNPKHGSRVYVKGYFAPTNFAISQPYVGGGWFYYTTTTSTPIQGLVVAHSSGGVWRRETKAEYSIEDFGAHESRSAIANGDAINIALANVTNVIVPSNKIFPCEMNKVNLRTGNRLYGGGTLQGTDPDMIKADVSGTYLRVDACENVIVRDITIKNGYKGKGVWMTNSRNIKFDNVTIDGFSYGMWIGESDGGIGCQNILINKPRILRTKYWGIYVRCLDVTDEAKKTLNITCKDGYFYWCNMAGFVCAEGHVKNVTLDNCVFDSCNLPMHFETCSDYVVNNARDYNTGKKTGMIAANTEYPFTGWSLYQIFTQNSKVTNSTLESTIYIGGGAGAKSTNHQYSNVNCKDYVFEGVGATADTNKNIFSDYKFNLCTVSGVLLYQQNDSPQSYLRNFTYTNCTCLLGTAAGGGNGNRIAMNPSRCVDLKVIDSTFASAALRIKSEGTLTIAGNTFNGTDNTQSQFEGLNSSLSNPSVFQFTGNVFKRAGGVVVGESAFLIKNWTRVRTDNTIRANNIPYAYRFTDNRLIELGYSWVYDTTVGNFVESGTVSLVYLYRA